MKLKLFLYVTIFFWACGMEQPQNDNELPLSEAEKIAEAYKQQFRWGFINKKGDLVIKADYEEVGNFQEGLCAVQKNNRWGFIDKNGKIIVQTIYKTVWAYSNGLAKILDDNNKVGFIDKNGKMVIQPQYESAINHHPILVQEKGKYFYIYRNNGKTLKRLGKFLYATPFLEDSTAIVETKQGFGKLHINGQYWIVPKYDDLKDNGNGFVAFRKNGQWGILDKHGKVVIEAQFQNIGTFYHDVTYAAQDNWYGLINTKGQFIVAPTYTQIWYAQTGLWVVVNTDGQHGLVNHIGQIILPMKYETILRFQEGYSAVLKNGLWAYINTSGQLITPFHYSLAWNFREGLARVIVKKDEQIFIDKNGKTQLIIPYEDVRDFHEGLAKVQLKMEVHKNR